MDIKELIAYLDRQIQNSRIERSNLHSKIEVYEEIKRIAEKEIK